MLFRSTHSMAQARATAQWLTVRPLGGSGIQVVWPQGWLPSPHPPPSPDSLAFCAHTQRAPLTARRCGLGSAPVLLRAQPGLLGWHDQSNVKPASPWALEPVPDSRAGSVETAPADTLARTRSAVSSLLLPGPPPRNRLRPGHSQVTRDSQVLPQDASPEG